MLIEGIDLTLGVEEEYQIINPETRDLDSYVRQFLEDGGHFTPDSAVRPELMQSQIEAGSSVCSSVPQIRSEIIRMRRQVRKLATEYGMAIASAGTHPFADWSKQTFTAGERYARFLNDMAGVANQLLTFGLHVHIGFGQDPQGTGKIPDLSGIDEPGGELSLPQCGQHQLLIAAGGFQENEVGAGFL